MVRNSQVPSGASEKGWAHISNCPILGDSAFCNAMFLLTISHTGFSVVTNLFLKCVFRFIVCKALN